MQKTSDTTEQRKPYAHCDESGVQDILKGGEVIGLTGEKTHTITPKKQGETTTILTFANACG